MSEWVLIVIMIVSEWVLMFLIEDGLDEHSFRGVFILVMAIRVTMLEMTHVEDS